MKNLSISALAILFVAGLVGQATAHGDEPHPKCKKGYVMTDDHRCVRP